MSFGASSVRAVARVCLPVLVAAFAPAVVAAPVAATLGSTATAGRLYLHSDSGAYAKDALADPTAATTFRAPTGSRLVAQAPTPGTTATAVYADGQLPGNVATPTFSVPRSTTSLTGVCVDLWLSKSGGTSPTTISLAVAFQVPGSGSGAGTIRTTTKKRPYTPGSVTRFTSYFVTEAPVLLSRGASIFFTTYIDSDQGLTIHYGSAAHASSVSVNGDPAACWSADVTAAERGGPTPKFTSETPPDVTLADDAAEPTVAVDWPTGAVLMQAGRRTVRAAPGPSGVEWAEASAPIASTYSRDPFLTSDHVTGRTWVSNLAVDCTNLAFTDDVGGMWVDNPRGCGPLSAIDHQSMASGPYPPGGALPVHPRAVYLCGNQVVGGACARSVDGGATFGPGRPMYSLAECAGSHGQIRVGPTGVLAVPVRECGGANTVAVSRDGGLTFTLHPMPNSVSEKESDPAVAFDASGVLYAFYVDDASYGSALRFVKSSAALPRFGPTTIATVRWPAANSSVPPSGASVAGSGSSPGPA